jgi:hypothetical protein
VNSILFSTSAGAPIAVLMLSQPVAAERSCVFVVAAHDVETFNSPEGQVLLPDRPVEYPCRYMARPEGVTVAFENQKGWRCEVRLDRSQQGHWTARKDGVLHTGEAASLTSLCGIETAA